MAVLDWTNDAYPLARKKRTGPPPTGTPPGTIVPATPRARVISFIARESIIAGNAVTMCSSRIVGPAFIDWFHCSDLSWNQAEAWRVYISNDSGHRDTSAVGMNLETGDIIFETAMRPGTVGFDIRTSAYQPLTKTTTSGDSGPIKIGMLIDRSEFFIKVQVYSVAASNNPKATLRVVENIPIALFPDFMAS